MAWGPLEAVAARIRPELFDCARSLGASRFDRFLNVMLPLLRPGLITAFLLAMVEIAKEMPATLMLRPFGWDTLAVRIYELTAEAQWERAAMPALVLVTLGAIPAVRADARPGQVQAIAERVGRRARACFSASSDARPLEFACCFPNSRARPR